jgi:hypothetical protein
LKLFGGKALEYLNALLVHVNAAPSYHQDKNSLAEHHWQTGLLLLSFHLVFGSMLSAALQKFAVISHTNLKMAL